eukprot:2007774-Pyramimonas_sp.AAC.1
MPGSGPRGRSPREARTSSLEPLETPRTARSEVQNLGPIRLALWPPWALGPSPYRRAVQNEARRQPRWNPALHFTLLPLSTPS